jgi:hypothetical protein
MIVSFLVPVLCMGVVSFGVMYQRRFLLFFGWLLTAILGLVLVLWTVMGIPITSEGPLLAIVAFSLFQSACAVLGWLWARVRERRLTHD